MLLNMKTKHRTLLKYSVKDFRINVNKGKIEHKRTRNQHFTNNKTHGVVIRMVETNKNINYFLA